MKKNFTVTLMSALLTATLAACNTASPSATSPSETAKAEADNNNKADTQAQQDKPELVLRLSEDQSPDYPTTLGCIRFAELVEERTNGRIKIEVYDSGTLGNTTAVIEQLQYGAIDFCRCGVGDLSQFSPRLSIFTLPFLYKDTESYYKCMDSDLSQDILKMEDATGLRGLCYYTNGARSFYSSKPLTCLADLKDLTIRTQESALMMSLMDSLNANPTPVAYSEVYSALQTGVVDAAENSISSYASTAHYEVAPNLMLDRHVFEPDLLIISQQIWNELSEEDQKILSEAAAESVTYERQIYEKYEEDALQKVKDAGVVITELTPEQQQEFIDATSSLAESLCSDYIDDVNSLKELQN